MCCGTEAGSYLKLTDCCITQLKAHGPSRTCNESKEEEEEGNTPVELPNKIALGRVMLSCISFLRVIRRRLSKLESCVSRRPPPNRPGGNPGANEWFL